MLAARTKRGVVFGVDGVRLDALRAAHTPCIDAVAVVLTDHGHRDGGGHGQRTRWERTAWIAARGPGIPVGVVDACHVDVAPQVLAAAGVPIQPEDGFSGVPFGARTVAAAA